MSRAVSPGQAARIQGLASAGFTVSEIVAATGYAEHVVRGCGKGLLDLKQSARAEETRARHRAIAIAYDSAPRGKRKALLAQFGVTSMGSLKVLACHGRRLLDHDPRVAEADPAPTARSQGIDLSGLGRAVQVAMRRGEDARRRPAAPLAISPDSRTLKDAVARRMVRAADCSDAPYDVLAERFGYKHAKSFKDALLRSRRHLAAEVRP